MFLCDNFSNARNSLSWALNQNTAWQGRVRSPVRFTAQKEMRDVFCVYMSLVLYLTWYKVVISRNLDSWQLQPGEPSIELFIWSWILCELLRIGILCSINACSRCFVSSHVSFLVNYLRREGRPAIQSKKLSESQMLLMPWTMRDEIGAKSIRLPLPASRENVQFLISLLQKLPFCSIFDSLP